MDGKGNSRLQYIDVLKGIAIILVLIGHRSVNEYVTVFIYFICRFSFSSADIWIV